MIAIGIDPGLTGAIAFVTSIGACTIEDIPTMPLPGNGLVKRKVDGRALADLLRKHCPIEASVQVTVEQVRAMGGKNNAVQTQGSLMRTLGAIEAVLEVLRMPTTPVEPMAWKRYFGLLQDARGVKLSKYDAKKAALRLARSLYPAAPLKLASHHNRAEALLMARYGLKELA